MTKNKKKKNFFKSDAATWIVLIIFLLALPVINVYTKTILSESNIKLESVKNEVKKQENINDSLKMEISELASLDKIQAVANENGLSYQNNNIKVVTNE